MGKYDDLFAEGDDLPPVWLDKKANRAAKEARGGKYGALFDDEPAQASRPLPDSSDMADVAARAKAARAKLEATPDSLDAFGSGLRRGASFGFGDEVEAAGQRFGDVLTGKQGPTYAEYRDLIRKRDAGYDAASPVASTIGDVAGGLVAGAAVPGLGAPAGLSPAARGLVSGAKFGAVTGAGNSTADLTRGDLGGLAQDVAASTTVGGITGAAMGKLIGDAPGRVDRRAVEAITRGEEGGTVRKKLADKAMAAVGEEGETLGAAIAENPDLQRALSVRAKSNPGAVGKMFSARLDQLNSETGPIYASIEQRIGKSPLNPLAARFDEFGRAAAESGDILTAEAFDKAKARLVAQYKVESPVKGTLSLDELPIRALRKLATTMGDELFPGLPTPATTRAKQQVYRAVVDYIADEGARAGADVSKLKSLNKKIATLIPVRDALADRATRAAQGHTTLGNLAVGTALIGAGAAGGGVEGAIAGAGADLARRAAMPAARAADYAIAQLVRAAQNGSRPAQLGKMALELGLSQQLSEAIAKRGIGALNESEEP